MNMFTYRKIINLGIILLILGFFIPVNSGYIEKNNENTPPIIHHPNPDDGAVDVSVNLIKINVTIEDPDGDIFDWSITTNPNIGSIVVLGDNNGTKTYNVSGLEFSTTYTWSVNANDYNGSNETTSVNFTFTTESDDNEPPNPPTIVNPSWWLPNEEYELFINTVDNELDNVEYYVDWGDGNIEDWFGPFQSGQETSVKHIWSCEGTFLVRVKARDNNSESEWSELTIRVSEINTTNVFLIGAFTDRRPVNDFIYFRTTGNALFLKFPPGSTIKVLQSGEEIVIFKEWLLAAVIEYEPYYFLFGIFKSYLLSNPD